MQRVDEEELVEIGSGHEVASRNKCVRIEPIGQKVDATSYYQVALRPRERRRTADYLSEAGLRCFASSCLQASTQSTDQSRARAFNPIPLEERTKVIRPAALLCHLLDLIHILNLGLLIQGHKVPAQRALHQHLSSRGIHDVHALGILDHDVGALR